MRLLHKLIPLLLIALVPLAIATERPRIGLVLSGGGTKGGAHLGVIRYLEQQRIPVDIVVGTSIGAVIGGLHAAGLSADEIEEAIRDINWDKLLQDKTERQHQPFRRKREHHDDLINFKPGFRDGEFKLPLGLLQGHGVSEFLRHHLRAVSHIDRFDALPIPFRAVSTDLLSGKEVVPDQGDLVAAIQASMTLPAILAPVEFEGQLLVDGGIANNLPVDIAKKMGADIVIAVDITSPLLKKQEVDSLLSVTDQVINLMTSRNVQVSIAKMGPDDVLIQPQVEGPSSLTYENIALTVEAGLTAADRQSDALQALALGPEGYARFQSRLPAAAETRRIATITINNGSAVSDEVIRYRLGIKPGDVFDAAALRKGIDRVFGTELFGRVDYRTRDEGTELDLQIDAVPRSWGPSYLQFGLQLQEDFANDTAFDFAIAYLQTGVNPLGGEIKTVLDLGDSQGLSIEWYQPMDWRASWYLNPKIEYERTRVRRYNQRGEATDELKIQGLGLELFAGTDINDNWRVETGYDRLFGKADRIVGRILLPTDEFELGELLLRTRYDTLDRVNLPNSGVSLDFTALLSRSYTGSSDDYEQIFGSALTAFSYGRYRVIANIEAGRTLNETAPQQSAFTLGGFGRLSGFAKDRFQGQNFGLININASRLMSRNSPVPLVLGYSLELGQAWTGQADKWLPAGAIFVAFDTPIGPTYIATGMGRGGENTLYLHLGNPFGQQRYRPFD